MVSDTTSREMLDMMKLCDCSRYYSNMDDGYDEIIEEENDDQDFLDYHTSLTHEDLEASGKPVRPLEFPTPVVYEGELVDLTASDHRTGVEYSLRNVLRRRGGNGDVAYLMKKKIAKSNYGFVRLGVVLRRQQHDSSWQSTGDFVAIKCSSWAKIQAMRGRHLIDPIKEISVLQLIGNCSDDQDQRVMGCHEVLQDAENLYTVMPYCSGGELYGKLDLSGLQTYPDEEQARDYFRQLLKALVFLQRKGICHRNVCLENMLLDANDNLVLLDSGLSLRVPYSDPSNIDGITDVSEGSIRRLMRPQGQCGQLMYLAPEILEQQPFDGHATDLWAAGITLFIMLVGVAPFGMAQCSDARFDKISRQGDLKSFLRSLEVSISAEAVDLLQNMLWRDPRHRFALADVMAHPWVMGVTPPTSTPPPLAVTPPPQVVENLRDDVSTRSSCRGSIKSHHTAATEATNGTPESPTSVRVVESSPRKRHRRKLSGARDTIMGKLKFMIPKKNGTAPGGPAAPSIPPSGPVQRASDGRRLAPIVEQAKISRLTSF